VRNSPLLLLLATLTAFSPVHAGGSAEDYVQALSVAKRTENTVFRTNFSVHWTPDGTRLWYGVRTGKNAAEYVAVDLATGKIARGGNPSAVELAAPKLTTSADASLQEQPSRRNGGETTIRLINRRPEPVALFWIDREGRRQAYGRIAAGESTEQSTFAGHMWLMADPAGATLGVIEAREEPIEIAIDGRAKATDTTATPTARESNTSPDGAWQVQFRDSNAFLHHRTTGEATALTTDGSAERPYRGPVSWAPDSRSLVLLAVKEVKPREITIVDSSPSDQIHPKVRKVVYPKPGDALPSPQPILIRLPEKIAQPIATDLFPNPFTPDGRLRFRWSPKSDEFYFDYNQRGHQLYRVVAVNTATGATRTVVKEKSPTFIDYQDKTWRHWLDQTGELLWLSERDGWAHLWLYDVASGTVKMQVTHGQWVVRKVLKVDETQREVWFLASGLRAGEDPYHQHLCRVRLDGSGFAQLTEGDGDHTIEFSPDGKFFVDTWSRADLPPVTELRRSETGTLVCELERGDIQPLLATGWSLPERFAAKGRDGKTEICGVIVKPSNFDPARKYPILEEVYAGPHGAFAPKTFGRLLRQHALAELGFIVVQADGMGTNDRGKAFHDVAWKNLRDAGFPDRMAWIKAAAATRPWMDLGRVGIYGGSAGGQSAMRALLDHADFYRAAFADCGCHDNRMDKIWWNEQWLGWPVDESYARNSNVVDATKLQGHLMLCVGELDTNVDPASTMQVAHALEKAGKVFDLLVVTGTGHGAAETPYASRRRMDFFVRHLLGTEPPAWP